MMMTKKRGVYLAFLAMVLVLLSAGGVGAQEIVVVNSTAYDHTFLDSPSDDTHTSDHPFSNGFNIKNIEVAADADAQTIAITFRFPCQAGNGNPSTDGECVALDFSAGSPSGATCRDDLPNDDCDDVNNARDDGPEFGSPTNELYEFVVSQGGVDLIRVEIFPSQPGAIVVPDLPEGGGPVTITPNTYDFDSIDAKEFTFTLGGVNNAGGTEKFSLLDDWCFEAFASSIIDGPGEDDLAGCFVVEIPEGFRCDYKRWNGQDQVVIADLDPTFPISLTTTVSVLNEGALPVDPFVITDDLEPDLSFVPGSVTVLQGPPGYVVGDPTVTGDPTTGETLTWNLDPLPAGVDGPMLTRLTIQYEILLLNLEVDETRENCVVVSSPGSGLPDSGPSSCCAEVTRLDIPVTPSLSGWGLLIALGVLPLLGLYLLRRQGKAAA